MGRASAFRIAPLDSFAGNRGRDHELPSHGLGLDWWQYAMHRVPFFWCFHDVHHTDLDLDVTTAARFHFGESFFFEAGNGVAAVILSAPALEFAG